jgi:hypothetical protein
MNGLETSAVTIISVGGLGWFFKYWITRTDKKIDDIVKNLNHIKNNCKFCKD